MVGFLSRERQRREEGIAAVAKIGYSSHDDVSDDGG